MPRSAPKSDAESEVGEVVPSRSSGASLSASKLRQTATRAPPGQDFGVSLRPTRATSTVWRSCSSVHLVPGWLGCARAVAARTGAVSRVSLRSAAAMIFPTVAH